MTTDAETIELDRELLAEYFHQQYVWIETFYPPAEWAAEVDLDAAQFTSYEEAEEYARGNLIGVQEDVETFRDWFDLDTEAMAREWAEEHGKDTFEKPPFSEEE